MQTSKTEGQQTRDEQEEAMGSNMRGRKCRRDSYDWRHAQKGRDKRTDKEMHGAKRTKRRRWRDFGQR